MWREVVNVKRMFKEMASTTKMELGRMHLELSGTGREVTGACSGVSVNLRQSTKIEVCFLGGFDPFRGSDCSEILLLAGSSTDAHRKGKH